MMIESNINGNTITISTPSRFDYNSHKGFKQAYSSSDGDNSLYVVDMSSTKYIDSSALGILLLLRNHANSDASRITIKGMHKEVKDILLVSNFDKLFTML